MNNAEGGSLRTLLTEGKAGPVVLGASMMDVARTLGPPRYFSMWGDDAPVPRYWGYDDLELGFGIRPPYKVEWLKLSPDRLNGRSLRVAHRLRLDLDGVHGKMTTATFLAHGPWSPASVSIVVQRVAGELQLILERRPARLLYVFMGDVPEADALMAAFQLRAWRDLVVAFEQHGQLREITAHADGNWRSRHWKGAPRISITGATYLKFTGGCRTMSRQGRSNAQRFGHSLQPLVPRP